MVKTPELPPQPSPPPQDPQGGRRRRIVDVVASRITPITRFKNADLKEMGQEWETWADVTVTTRQRVDLDWVVTAHPDRLPPDVSALPDQAAMEAELQSLLVLAESMAGPKIQQWSTEEPGQYRRLLPRGLFTAGLDQTLGVERACVRCAQSGQIQCPTCRGTTCCTCPECQGKKRTPCPRCDGLGRQPCGACQGSGQISSPANASSTASSAPPASMQPCTACSGGWIGCDACRASGEVSCARCAATGQLPCEHCHSNGRLDCPDCATTGWQHLRGQLREHIEVEELQETHHPDPVVAAYITQRFTDIPTLDQVCDLEQVRYTTAPFAVQAIHRLKLSIRQVPLQVAGQPLHFTAYGPELEISDFRQIGSTLLLQDLVTLEKNAFGSGRYLLDALQRFVASELNVLIAERVAPAEIEKRFASLIDAPYIQRSVQVADKAIERLWLQRIRKPTLGCVLGAGGLSAALLALGSPYTSLVSASTLALAAAALLWQVLDWRVRTQLGRDINPQGGERILRPLGTLARVQRTKLLALGVAAVLSVVGALAASRLPHVQQAQALAQAESDPASAGANAASGLGDKPHSAGKVDKATLRDLNQQLDDWFVRDGKDYRLRSYPASPLLREAADQHHDTRALTVLAWKHLMGIDGDANPQQARQWLQPLVADPISGTAARIGVARATLMLESRALGTLQQALDDLAQIQDAQLPEALYTRALIELSPAMSIRSSDVRAGLEALQQAADMGHATACYELGRRLATGNGLPRNPKGALRYLNFAASKGVTGAKELLAKLSTGN